MSIIILHFFRRKYLFYDYYNDIASCVNTYIPVILILLT